MAKNPFSFNWQDNLANMNKQLIQSASKKPENFSAINQIQTTGEVPVEYNRPGQIFTAEETKAAIEKRKQEPVVPVTDFGNIATSFKENAMKPEVAINRPTKEQMADAIEYSDVGSVGQFLEDNAKYMQGGEGGTPTDMKIYGGKTRWVTDGQNAYPIESVEAKAMKDAYEADPEANQLGYIELDQQRNPGLVERLASFATGGKVDPYNVQEGYINDIGVSVDPTKADPVVEGRRAPDAVQATNTALGFHSRDLGTRVSNEFQALDRLNNYLPAIPEMAFGEARFAAYAPDGSKVADIEDVDEWDPNSHAVYEIAYEPYEDGQEPTGFYGIQLPDGRVISYEDYANAVAAFQAEYTPTDSAGQEISIDDLFDTNDILNTDPESITVYNPENAVSVSPYYTLTRFDNGSEFLGEAQLSYDQTNKGTLGLNDQVSEIRPWFAIGEENTDLRKGYAQDIAAGMTPEQALSNAGSNAARYGFAMLANSAPYMLPKQISVPMAIGETIGNARAMNGATFGGIKEERYDPERTDVQAFGEVATPTMNLASESVGGFGSSGSFIAGAIGKLGGKGLQQRYLNSPKILRSFLEEGFEEPIATSASEIAEHGTNAYMNQELNPETGEMEYVDTSASDRFRNWMVAHTNDAIAGAAFGGALGTVNYASPASIIQRQQMKEDAEGRDLGRYTEFVAPAAKYGMTDAEYSEYIKERAKKMGMYRKEGDE